MASPTETLAALGDNFGALGGLVGGLAQGSLDRAQARAHEQAGLTAASEANAREEQVRREARQTLGEQVAEIGESGAGFTSTARDLMDQSAANASLDALNARYSGTVELFNQMNEAQALRRQAKAEPFIGALNGAAKALTFARAYGAGG